MSVEQEAEMLERQEEEFQEAFAGSEEDVFGHGVTRRRKRGERGTRKDSTTD